MEYQCIKSSNSEKKTGIFKIQRRRVLQNRPRTDTDVSVDVTSGLCELYASK